MKYFFSCLVFLLSNLGFADYGEVQNGGGGLIENGTVMTFYSAHIPVIPTPLQSESIPGMSFLIQQVAKMPLSARDRADLLSAIAPNSLHDRSYYKVEDVKLNPQQMQQIVHEYSQLANVSEQSIVLFAVTNPNIRATVLFPNFFELKKPSEQAAILLHESSWLETDLSYKDILQFEEVAQQYFETAGTDPANYFNFYTLLGKICFNGPPDNRILITASVAHDLQANYLTSAGLARGHIYLKDLFGEKYLHCMAQPYNGNMFQHTDACNSQLRIDLTLNSQAHPSFLLLKLLASGLQESYSDSEDGLQGFWYAPKNWNLLSVNFNPSGANYDASFEIYRGEKQIGYLLFR